MPASHAVTIVIITTLLLVGCASGTGPTSTAAVAPSAACTTVIPSADAQAMPAATGVSGDTSPSSNGRNNGSRAEPVTIALSEPVDPAHAPWPRNDGERLVFAQLYEPLVRIDCTGRVVPGLAASWSSDPSHREWTFVLRDSAVFRGGGAVTAPEVIESWRAGATALSGAPAGAMLAAISTGARAIDSATLVVTLTDSLQSPRIFGAPELAVLHEATGNAWPDGTTSYYVDSGVDAGAAPVASPAVARPITLRSSGTAPPLLFRVYQRRDPRDILDAGVDLLATESSAAVQYAATQPGRKVFPLPWNRTYALAIPSRSTVVDAHPDCDPVEARAFRAALASAVHADARGAELPLWWGRHAGATDAAGTTRSAPACRDSTHRPANGAAPSSSTELRLRNSSRRIVYRRDDPTARELAERIVALAAPGSESASETGLASVAPELLGDDAWRAAGLDSLDFARTLAAGDESAYVIELPRSPAAATLASSTLATAAPWLASPAQRAFAMIPLIDTRASLIARRSSSPLQLTIDWNGAPRFGAPAAIAPEPTR